MRHYCKSSIVMLLIFVIIFMLASCGSTSSEASAEASLSETTDTTPDVIEISEEDIIGKLELPSKIKRIRKEFDDSDTQATLLLQYADINLVQVISFMDLLSQDQWYITENSAYKGALSLDISYSMDSKQLTLNFLYDKEKAEWPEGLTLYLAYITPAFPFGQYDHYEKSQTSTNEDATLLVYKKVDEDQINKYEQMLLDDGYTLSEDNGTKFYEKGTCFVEIAFEAFDGVAKIFVGQYEVSAVPLPPWPEPVPEHLQQILPPVAAVLTATGGEDTIVVKAEQMSLCDLYGFVKSAETHYGWTALYEDDGLIVMLHEETDFAIVMRAFDTDEETWMVEIFDAFQLNLTQPPEATQTSGSTETDVEFEYKVTEGRYSEQDAMTGVYAEFGQYAEMADWSEIKAEHSGEMTAFLESAGVQVDGDVWVQDNGERFDGKRHYFLALISEPRDNFKLYDNVGNEAWLGSWYGVEMQVLVKVPVGDGEDTETEFEYKVTEGRYSEQDAMMGVLDEFGQYAEMADWSEIKAKHSGDMTAFLESAGVQVDEDVWVQYNGERFDGKRHYFLARISEPRDNFKLYDSVGNEAWLGSWYGIEMQVLVKVPPDDYIPSDHL